MDEASDPDDNEPQVHIFNLPPEMEQQMRAIHDQRQMANEAMRHEIKNFFDELSSSQLVTLRMILDGLSAGPTPRIRASFYEGVCVTLLEHKHGVCAACGQDHEADFLSFSADSTTDDDDEDEQ